MNYKENRQYPSDAWLICVNLFYPYLNYERKWNKLTVQSSFNVCNIAFSQKKKKENEIIAYVMTRPELVLWMKKFILVEFHPTQFKLDMSVPVVFWITVVQTEKIKSWLGAFVVQFDLGNCYKLNWSTFFIRFDSRVQVQILTALG